ncbi:MAG TPA: GMC family oxidoreductase, partial [Candidatus Limnocylindria bacterium]|nr:GMC family oxidoreductase [Candidatus Limnocylindria bacterium]
KRVIVLERARLRTEVDFDGKELPGYASLFLDRGIASTEDRAIAVLAGSAVGGGTVVNWNTSLRVPPSVRDEWRASGVDDLDRHYDAVESRLDVDADESARNGPNAVLERGLRALGWSCATVRRNVKGCGDCGHCMLGCRRGAKQSTLRTYLADACAAGAEVLPGAEARRIELEAGRASAVVARVDGGEIRIRAPLVALAGGAVLSPALLLRSGIAPAQAGRHLHLHPVAVTTGEYDDDLAGHWSGVPQSVLSEEFADLEAGYGFRIEVPAAYPGVFAASTPWWGSAYHLERAARFRHFAAFIAIVRDRGEGQIKVDRAGEALIHYACGPLERELLTIAMARCADLHRAAGARRIATLHTPPLELSADEDFDTFTAEIRRRGVVPHRVTLFTAHQMSSCRMATSPRDGVADPDGQVWGMRGLFVTDASAFPSACGVNPMLTVMALAHRTAERMR